MVDLLTNVGEEYLVENNADGESIDVTLYNDSTDALGETNNLADITTEPSGSSFSRQTDTVTTEQLSGDFGFNNDNKLTFDTSDSSQTVDAYAVIINFQSDSVAGDGGATDNLVAAGDLSQSRDLSQISSFEIPAGDAQVTVN